MSKPLVSPPPPLATEDVPHVGAGLRFLDAPTAYLQELRARCGDTFLVDFFGFQLLMTFSPQGLESLYKLDESEASFGLATFDLASFKTPLEIFADADPDLFRDLLLFKRLPAYVEIINDLVDHELERWGNAGEVDIFDAIRTLEQRVGYGLWICREAADDRHWPALKRAFDVLDQEQSFVNPQATLATLKSNKAAERAAIAEIGERIDRIAAEHDANPARQPATIDLLRERFANVPEADRRRRLVHNTINANQGFLSNLYAAIAWVVVRLLEYPDVLAKVRDEIARVRRDFGDGFTGSGDALNALIYLEQVTMESIRLAQRSITLRKVLAPVRFDVGDRVYTVAPGVYIATMLSVTNIQTADLARFDPDHYTKNLLSGALTILGKETVSTFGHGKHACPAQKFSHHMTKIVLAKLLDRFDLEPRFTAPEPSARQLGGVARPDQPARVAFRVKKI